MQKLAIIGGTGMKKLFGEQMQDFLGASGFEISHREHRDIQSDYGHTSVLDISLKKDGCDHQIFFVHRHHSPDGRTIPPHALNHHATVSALASLQPDAIMTVHSVGTMSNGFPPGIVGFASDFIDFTGVVTTFHDQDAVHVDMGGHFRKELRDAVRPVLQTQARDLDVDLHLAHVVSQSTGPQFETPAQIRAFVMLGSTAVGMTMIPEAKLIAEKGMKQLALLASSNWAAGMSPEGKDAPIDHLSVESKAEKMQEVIGRCVVTLLNAEMDV